MREDVTDECTGTKKDARDGVRSSLQRMPLSEALTKATSLKQYQHAVMPGRRKLGQREGSSELLTSRKQKVEHLAVKFANEVRGGRQSEKDCWDALDHIISTMPMYTRRNGVKILQFGAMQVRGGRLAAGDANYPQCVLMLHEFMKVHGPIPVRHLEWGQMSIVCIRGKCSSYHVDAHNGLTFTACSNDGLAAVKLEYVDRVDETLGRFWTEILPRCMHRVVAMVERSAISVYLPQMAPYSVAEAKVNGPTQMVIRMKDGKGETQHAWPSSASARFLLSQCLRQIGSEATYTHIKMTAPNGRQIGMDEIVPAGSTVFVQLDTRATCCTLTAGAKWGNQHLSDGEVIKKIRQVRPQLEPQQVKALLRGSPKLLKAVHNKAQGKQLLDQIMQEEKRQGMVPKLGMKSEVDGSKQLDSQAGWQQVDMEESA
eukprot:3679109-Amphidinium_carterae.4